MNSRFSPSNVVRTPSAEVRFFAEHIIDDSRHSELFMKRRRGVWAVLLVTIYLAFVLVLVSSFPPSGSPLPDTNAYLEFSPYRQPMYGMWANGIHALSGSWRAVELLQIAAFVSFSAWAIIELALISNVGVLSALLFLAMLVIVARLGLLNVVGSLISEGLFYPMIMLMAAMLLAWLRTSRTSLLVGLALVLVGMTQLRTAALLVVAVPIFAAVCVLARQPRRSPKSRAAVLTLATIGVGLVFLPSLLGKSVMQISTASDSLGFVLLPRVSLLPPSNVLGERSPDWIAMSSTWRDASKQVSVVGLTQFDAQLQEAIRYNLGPKVLLPAILNRSPEEVQEGWPKGIYYDDAKRIAIDWIRDQWRTYIRLSGIHLWGMLTMANFMDNADRERVWKALNTVSDLTWREAPFRTDYPLNRIYERLSWSTNILYLLIRYGSIAVLIIGTMSAMIVLRQMRANRAVSSGSLALVLAVGWSIAHSLPAAFLVFPDFKYTYANMLVMVSGGAAWLAYLGANRRFSELRDKIICDLQ